MFDMNERLLRLSISIVKRLVTKFINVSKTSPFKLTLGACRNQDHPTTPTVHYIRRKRGGIHVVSLTSRFGENKKEKSMF